MSMAKRCDVCGNFFEKNEVKVLNDSKVTIKFKKITVHGISLAYPTKEYNMDLCDECAAKVLDIVEPYFLKLYGNI